LWQYYRENKGKGKKERGRKEGSVILRAGPDQASNGIQADGERAITEGNLQGRYGAGYVFE